MQPEPSASSNAATVTRVDKSPRARPPELALESPDRSTGFDEVVYTLTEEQARAEADRCMVCGRCGNCRSCIDLFGCPAFFEEDGHIHIDEGLCNGCGVCALFCPNGAINPVGGGSR